MKKITAIILCAGFVLSLCGCKSKPQTQSSYYYFYDSSFSEPQTVQTTPSEDASSQKAKKSTVATPSKVVFYKDGQEVISTDKELNKKIAKHVESYYKDQEQETRTKTAINESTVMAMRGQDMAVELIFDAPTSFYGGFLGASTTAIFIPLTRNILIENYGNENYDHSSGPLRHNPKGLEKFFPEIFNQPAKLGAPEYCAVKQKYETAWGRYVKTISGAEQSNYDSNDIYLFKNDDGVEIEKDAKTGEILRIDFNNKVKNSSITLTEEKALEAAESYAKIMYDLAPYDKKTVKKVGSEYYVTLMRTINGLDTWQFITVRVNEDSTIRSISKKPNLFDGIDTAKISITQEEIKQKVEQKHIEKHGDQFLYLNFYSIRLTVKEKRLQAEVQYQEVYKQGNEHKDGALIETYMDLT